MDQNTLKKLGLTDTEIKVYLCLLKHGRLSISMITLQTHLNRTNLYNVIEEKKKYFEAAKPTRILEYLEEKKMELTQQENSINELVKELSAIHPNKQTILNVEIFRGNKGIKTILEDVFIECKKGDEVLAFGFGGSNFVKILGLYYHHYIKKHTQAGLKFRAIFNEDEQNEEYVKKLGEVKNTAAKFPFKNYETPTHTRIYGNKVAIILMEKEPTAILITDPKIAKGYQYFFEFLWVHSS